MNKVIKKITATAMALTLLGTGAVATNFIAPMSSNNTITASAANYTTAFWNYTRPVSTYNYGGNGKLAGSGVYWIQAAMNYCIGAGLDVDGQYGAKTTAAVRTFQSIYNYWYGGNLTVDGIFGPNTYRAMVSLGY